MRSYFVTGLAFLALCGVASASVTTRITLTYGLATVVSEPGASVPVMLEALGGDAYCAFNGTIQHAHQGFLFKKGQPFTVPAEHTTEGIWCTPAYNIWTEMRVVP